MSDAASSREPTSEPVVPETGAASLSSRYEFVVLHCSLLLLEPLTEGAEDAEEEEPTPHPSFTLKVRVAELTESKEFNEVLLFEKKLT